MESLNKKYKKNKYQSLGNYCCLFCKLSIVFLLLKDPSSYSLEKINNFYVIRLII